MFLCTKILQKTSVPYWMWNSNAVCILLTEPPQPEEHKYFLINLHEIWILRILAGMSQTSYSSLWDDRRIFSFLRHSALCSCGIILMFSFLLLFSTHTHFNAQRWTSRQTNDNILRAAHISCHCTVVMEETIFLTCLELNTQGKCNRKLS